MHDFLNMICCNSDSDFSPGLSHRCCHSLCQAACHGAGPLGDIFIFHLEILCILEENPTKILSSGRSDWQREFQCYGDCKGKSYSHLSAMIFRLEVGWIWCCTAGVFPGFAKPLWNVQMLAVGCLPIYWSLGFFQIEVTHKFDKLKAWHQAKRV